MGLIDIEFDPNSENDIIENDVNTINKLNNIYNSLSKEYEKNIIELSNNDFKNGTYQIKEPGYYKLTENIEFDPNSENDYMPTPEQIQSGKYPVGQNGAYHLGFFAAITIETKDVILDLNNFTIEQSKKHNLLQRFYANIEMNSSPFIPGQGPSTKKFSSDDKGTPTSFRTAENCFILNGKLGLSSHHGIHGNINKNCVFKNLNINTYEVGGIALNGAENSVLLDITCDARPIEKNIKVLSTFSQAVFMNRFLKKKLKETVTFKNKSIKDIQLKLQDDIDTAVDDYINDRDISIDYFVNKDGEYDGNMYGILLNVKGIAIHNFPDSRKGDMIGNINNILINIDVKNIITAPLEVIALNATDNGDDNGYSGGRLKGPFGDIFEIQNVTDNDGKYKGNTLSDAQLILSKLSDGKGTNNIPQHIVDWAENDLLINDVMNDNNMYYVGGGDSMGHAMKGNIAYFVICGINISLYNCTVENMKIVNTNIGKTGLIDNDNIVYNGATNYSFICNCCKNVHIFNMKYVKDINGNITWKSFPELTL
jgi:hypothetical protein